MMLLVNQTFVALQTETLQQRLCGYSGMFPCFFGGFLSRFVSSIANA